MLKTKKNYAMESLPVIDLENWLGDVGAILQLNEAGRRYLIEDGSSISKGVKVSSAEAIKLIACSCTCWRIRDCAKEVPLRPQVIRVLLIMLDGRVR
jgi:hypothetical protein